jgi:hypothetical protein
MLPKFSRSSAIRVCSVNTDVDARPTLPAAVPKVCRLRNAATSAVRVELWRYGHVATSGDAAGTSAPRYDMSPAPSAALRCTPKGIQSVRPDTALAPAPTSFDQFHPSLENRSTMSPLAPIGRTHPEPIRVDLRRERIGTSHRRWIVLICGNWTKVRSVTRFDGTSSWFHRS